MKKFIQKIKNINKPKIQHNNEKIEDNTKPDTSSNELIECKHNNNSILQIGNRNYCTICTNWIINKN